MGSEGLHENACWNAPRFESGPITRYFPVGCGSLCTISGVDGEGRRLEDAGGEDDLVQERVVVRVAGRRRHAPAAAVGGLADGATLVVDHEPSSLDHVLPERRVAADADVRVVFPFVRVAD